MSREQTQHAAIGVACEKWRRERFGQSPVQNVDQLTLSDELPVLLTLLPAPAPPKLHEYKRWDYDDS